MANSKKKQLESDALVRSTVNNTRSKVEYKGPYKGEKYYAKQSAHNAYKDKEFDGKDSVKDIYGEDVYRTEAEAKAHYGDDYAKHTASVEHIVSCKKIAAKTRYNPFLSDEDVKAIVNNEENYAITNMADNQSKGGESKCSDKAKEKGMSEQEQKEIKEKEKKAEKAVKKDISVRTVKNAGMAAAEGVKNSLPTLAADTTINGIKRLADGDEPEEILKDSAVGIAHGAGEAAKAAVVQPVIEAGIQYTKDHVVNEAAKKALDALDDHGLAGGIYSAAKDSAFIIKSSIEKGYVDKQDIQAVAISEVQSGVRQWTKTTISTLVTTQIQKVSQIIIEKTSSEVFKKLGTALGSAAGPVGAVVGYFAGYVAGALVGAAMKFFFDFWNTEEIDVNAIILENMEAYYTKMENELNQIHEQHRQIIISSFIVMRDGIYNNNADVFDIGLSCLCSEFGFGDVIISRQEFDEKMNNQEYTFEFGYKQSPSKANKQLETGSSKQISEIIN